MDTRTPERIRIYATFAGVLGLISVVAGGFGEAFVPMTVVADASASATAANIAASELLMRWGFAAYLVEAICDVTLTLLFYSLFGAVWMDAALLGVFFRLIGTAGFAIAHVLFFASLPTVIDAQPLEAFSAGQLNALALLLIRISEYSQTVFTMFYGIGTLVFGYLMYRSRMLPSVVAVLVMLASTGFILKALTWVLVPTLSSPLLLAPAGAVFLLLSVWLIIKGVDARKPLAADAV